jgi:hypothetical protein
MPLAHFVDSAGPDAIAATVEMDSEARIYPVLYLRRSGKVDELVMGPDPLHDFGREEYRRELESLLRL